MLISIIITFYDKDYKCIPSILTEITKLKFDHEIIFVDDRNDKTIDVASMYNIPKKYKIVNSSLIDNNVGTFEARRTGALNATGDYIWFVDIDDKLENITKFPTDEDVSVYTYSLLTQSKTINFNMFVNLPFTELIPNKINIEYILYISKYSLWNKLIKRDTLLKTFSNIPFLKGFKNHEDGYLLFEVLSNSKLVRFKFETIYKYCNSEYQDKLFNDDKTSDNLYERFNTRIPDNCSKKQEYIRLLMKMYK